METELLLKPEEAAALLRIGLNECYKCLNNHTLVGYRVGRSWRIPQQSITQYINNQIESELRKQRNG